MLKLLRLLLLLMFYAILIVKTTDSSSIIFDRLLLDSTASKPTKSTSMNLTKSVIPITNNGIDDNENTNFSRNSNIENLPIELDEDATENSSTTKSIITSSTTTIIPLNNTLNSTESIINKNNTNINNNNRKLSVLKSINKLDLRKRKPITADDDHSQSSMTVIPMVLTNEWKCPNISQSRNLECGCDIPHTLRCSGNIHSLEHIAKALRNSKYSVSLLDCTLKNVTFLNDAKIFENISLHGLVISSGEIKRIHRSAFAGLKGQLQALGLPNNALINVPWVSLSPLTALERLDLSNNRIKFIGSSDFTSLTNLTYLELSENQISRISLRAFSVQKKLITLRLGGNRFGDFSENFKTLELCINLRELDLKSNNIKGDLTNITLPRLTTLESLNLERNLLTCIRNGSFQYYPYLITLTLSHNQIDVLEDLAFIGLNSLQQLDLSYNGIVAISGSSLQYIPQLLILDLTHNFLRALTSDLIDPLPILKELRLDGNDISIVSKTALDTATELTSLSLQDNPLSCDCTLRPFAEWLSSLSKITSKDLLGATCATPPHLEGAPLIQIPLASLNCDGGSYNSNDNDNANILQQLDSISKQINISVIKDFSDVITMKSIHFSTDYGLILTWAINLKNDEFTCDAVFVYKETNIHEILLDNSPIHCEGSIVNNENLVSVILRDITNLEIGESYRFCLVLIQEKNVKRDLVVGCSNITKLELLEKNLMDLNNNQNTIIAGNTDETLIHPPIIEKISIYDDDVDNDDDINRNDHSLLKLQNNLSSLSTSTNDNNNNVAINQSINNTQTTAFELFNRIHLAGITIGLTSACIFICYLAITKYRNNKIQNTTVSTCYTATNDQLINGHHPHHHSHHDSETRNRYLKLQATTSL